MEGAFIFYGNNSNAIKKEGWLSAQPFFKNFFYFVDLQPQRAMGLFSVEPRKESTSSYPLDFLNYSAVQRSAAPAAC